MKGRFIWNSFCALSEFTFLQTHKPKHWAFCHSCVGANCSWNWSLLYKLHVDPRMFVQTRASNPGAQTEQLKGFSPVWILICTFILCLRVNPLPQTEQLKAFSPVWCLMRLTASLLHWNLLAQTKQEKAFPSAWTFKWPCKDGLLWYFSPQTEQLKGFSLVRVLIC